MTLVDIAGNTTTLNITSSPNSTGTGTGTAQVTRPSSSNVATGPGSNNNLGANNRATSNAVALSRGLNFMNVGGVVKVLGAFLLAGASVVGVGFLG
jgi:hypothetical protein